MRSLFCWVLQVKLLLQVVKEFTSDKGDAAFTIGVVSLLLECVRLSFRPGIAHVDYYVFQVVISNHVA